MTRIFDLEPVAEMSPFIGVLHAMARFNYLRAQRFVEEVSQAEIDFRGPDGKSNSIAQLIRHLAVVDLYWVYRLQSLTIPEALQARFGPMYSEDGKLPMVSKVPLATLLKEYDEVQEMLTRVCLKLTDDDLERVVGYENGNRATIRWGIWHIADHSRHHYANMIQMKKQYESCMKR